MRRHNNHMQNKNTSWNCAKQVIQVPHASSYLCNFAGYCEQLEVFPAQLRIFGMGRMLQRCLECLSTEQDTLLILCMMHRLHAYVCQDMLCTCPHSGAQKCQVCEEKMASVQHMLSDILTSLISSFQLMKHNIH